MLELPIMANGERLNPSENIADSDIYLNKSEQRAVFHGLTSYLMLQTRHEVDGLLTPELIEINDNLRSVVKKIISNDETLNCDRLLMGIVDDMSDLQLATKAIDDHYDNVNRTDEIAGYFLRKRKEK